MNLSLPASWLLSCYGWHTKNRVNSLLHKNFICSATFFFFPCTNTHTHLLLMDEDSIHTPPAAVFSLWVWFPPPCPRWCVVSNSFIFMCRRSRSCHWSGLLVKLTLIIFSRTSLVWTERAQCTAGGGWGVGGWVCLSSGMGCFCPPCSPPCQY